MIRIVTLFILVAVTFNAAIAGVVFEIEMKDMDATPPKVETMQVLAEGRNLKVKISGQNQRPGSEMIYRGDRREMIAVDHASQSYIVMDPKTMQAVGAQAQQAFGEMEAKMRNMTPEQRAMLEQAIGGNLPGMQQPQQAKLVVQQMNDRRNIYGYQCTLYQVTRNRQKTSDAWITSWQNIDGGAEIIQAFTDLGQFMQQISESMPKQSGMAAGFDETFLTIKDFNGFPVASREYRADGSVESETALRNTQKKRLNPAEFDPPARYRRQQMFDGAGMLGPSGPSTANRQPNW